MRFLLPVTTILLGIFLLQCGAGALQTLLAIRLDAEGLRAPVIALVGVSYFAGLTLGAHRVFRIIRRVGHIRAFAAFVSLYSATAITYSLIDSVVVWTVLRFVDGFCVAGVFVCLESWLNDRADHERRGTTLAFYMIALYAGQALSQGLLVLGEADAQRPFIIAALILSLTIWPVALTKLPEPIMDQQRVFTLRQLYETSPLGLVGSAATGLMLGAFYAMGAVHAQRIGMSTVAIAGLMSAVIAGGVALQWPLGRLSDRFDRRTVIVFTLAATVAVAMAMTTIAQPTIFTVFGALFGGFAFALYPLCVAHTNDQVESDERTSANGGLILVYSIGAVIGPLIASAVMMLLGPGGLYGFIGAIAFLALLFGLWRQLSTLPVPIYAQRAFLLLPRTTPMASALDQEIDPDD